MVQRLTEEMAVQRKILDRLTTAANQQPSTPKENPGKDKTKRQRKQQQQQATGKA